MCSRTKPINIKRDDSEDDAVDHVHLDDTFMKRVQLSVIEAKRKIMKKDITPTIEITGETGVSIVIGDTVEQSGKEYMVIYRGNDTKHHTPFIKIPKDKFVYVYFGGMNGCRIFIKSKLLRVMFDRCDECQISVRTPIIGVVDFYKCKSATISFRIADPLLTPHDVPFPLVTVEDCANIQFFQSVESVLFAVKLSVDIYGTITDTTTGQRLAQYDLGKIMWDPNEQNFVTLSRTNGFASVSSDYSLQQISHTLFIDSSPDLLGTTPEFRR